MVSSFWDVSGFGYHPHEELGHLTGTAPTMPGLGLSLGVCKVIFLKESVFRNPGRHFGGWAGQAVPNTMQECPCFMGFMHRIWADKLGSQHQWDFCYPFGLTTTGSVGIKHEWAFCCSVVSGVSCFVFLSSSELTGSLYLSTQPGAGSSLASPSGVTRDSAFPCFSCWVCLAPASCGSCFFVAAPAEGLFWHA